MIRKAFVNKSRLEIRKIPVNDSKMVIIQHQTIRNEIHRIHEELKATERTLQAFLNNLETQTKP